MGDHFHFPKEKSGGGGEENKEGNNGDQEGEGRGDDMDNDTDNDKDGKLLLGQKFSFAPYSHPTKQVPLPAPQVAGKETEARRS